MHIVIVNYATAPLTIDCLRSLAEELHTVSNVKATVVDNASPDGSAGRIAAAVRENHWHWASLLPLQHNGGFAAGNNAAICTIIREPDAPEYILLLNPDTLVRPGALAALVEFMDEHPQAGIAGSRIEHTDGTPQGSAFRFHSVVSELENGLRLGPASRLLRRWMVVRPMPDQPCRTDWVSGAAMMVRREVFERIGLLDEGYFMYFEEVDFCLRAWRAGFECWQVPHSRVVHLVGRASGINVPDRPPQRRPGYWFDSRRRYFVKNHGRLYAALADLAWASGYSVWRVRRLIQGKPDSDPPKLLVDFLRHSALVRGL